MGWLALIAIRPLVHLLPFGGIVWLVLGGLCYTVGVIFYVTDHKIKFGHFIWHYGALSMIPGVAIGLDKEFSVPNPGAADLNNWIHASCESFEDNFGTPGSINENCDPTE